jgi:hypothetical protein
MFGNCITSPLERWFANCEKFKCISQRFDPSNYFSFYKRYNKKILIIDLVEILNHMATKTQKVYSF